MKKLPTSEPRAEDFGLSPEKWEIVKQIFKDIDIPQENQIQKIIDTRPSQKKITDFFSK